MTEAIEIGGKEYSPSDLVVCKVEKNRHGQTRNLALRFLPETMTFTDYNI
jgi:replicative DNA helicase